MSTTGPSKDLGEVLEAQTVIKCYQIVAQCLRNNLRP